jgi:hypothetical protein
LGLSPDGDVLLQTDVVIVAWNFVRFTRLGLIVSNGRYLHETPVTDFFFTCKLIQLMDVRPDLCQVFVWGVHQTSNIETTARTSSRAVSG